MCHGSGLVCPRCRGMRFLRSGPMQDYMTQIERCTRCMDPDEELRAIGDYLNHWFAHHPATTTEQEPRP